MDETTFGVRLFLTSVAVRSFSLYLCLLSIRGLGGGLVLCLSVASDHSRFVAWFFSFLRPAGRAVSIGYLWVDSQFDA